MTLMMGHFCASFFYLSFLSPAEHKFLIGIVCIRVREVNWTRTRPYVPSPSSSLAIAILYRPESRDALVV